MRVSAFGRADASEVARLVVVVATVKVAVQKEAAVKVVTVLMADEMAMPATLTTREQSEAIVAVVVQLKAVMVVRCSCGHCSTGCWSRCSCCCGVQAAQPALLAHCSRAFGERSSRKNGGGRGAVDAEGVCATADKNLEPPGLLFWMSCANQNHRSSARRCCSGNEGLACEASDNPRAP